MSRESVGIVFVSHSPQIADGDGGARRSDGAARCAWSPRAARTTRGSGPASRRSCPAIAEADSGDGVVVVSDLGSALLTAETVLDMLDEEQRGRVRVVDVPFVEGGVAAAVAAESGGDSTRSRPRGAGRVGCLGRRGAQSRQPRPRSDAAAAPAGGRYEREVLVRNPRGPARAPRRRVRQAGEHVPREGDGQRQGREEPAGHHVARADRRFDRPDRVRRRRRPSAVDALADLVDTGFGEV